MTNYIRRVQEAVTGFSTGYLGLSYDGKTIAYSTMLAQAPVDKNNTADVYVKNLFTGTVQLGSLTAAGVIGTSSSDQPQLSADGRYLGFTSYSTELGVTDNRGDFNQGVFIKDLLTGALLRADVNAAGLPAEGSGKFSLSADGRHIAFVSSGSLVAGDINHAQNVYVKDMLTGAIDYAARTSDGTRLTGISYQAAMSGDGRFVTFTSFSAFGTLTANVSRIYIKDMLTGSLRLVSAFDDPAFINRSCSESVISADGHVVGFQSNAININTRTDERALFARDMQTGQLQRINADANGVPAANGYTEDLQLSADGRFAVFSSLDGGLVPGDTNKMFDIFIKDLLTGAIRRLSVSDDGLQANGANSAPRISGDGSTVSFRSEASNLIAGDTNKLPDIFVVKVDPAFLNAWAGRITGSANGEQLTGSAAADHLIGLGGNDSIDGGAGADMAVLRGWRADYTVTRSGASLVVRDNTGLDGTDTLTRVERLHFTDATVAYDIDGTAGQAYRLYQAAFNRTPDAGGLGFWIAQMDDGMGINAVAQAMMGSNEFTALYGTAPSNAALVDKFYLNVLHRSGEPAGVQYWNDMLDTKAVTPAQVLALISEGSENQAALIGTIENGIAYLPY
jgi:Tol biopolymer transport system component